MTLGGRTNVLDSIEDTLADGTAMGSVVGLDICFATALNSIQHHGHSLNMSVESNVH